MLNETSFAFARAQPGQKKGFFDWLLEKSCRDSSEIGAGYEDDLKSGAFKPKGGLDISDPQPQCRPWGHGGQRPP